MVIFYKKWKKYTEIQLTKNKMDLNVRKMINHPPSPENFGGDVIQIKSNTFNKHNYCLKI